MTWQPIETARKDGTEVLTYRMAGLMAVAVYWPVGDAEWCATDGIHLTNVTHWWDFGDGRTAPPPPTSETNPTDAQGGM